MRMQHPQVHQRTDRKGSYWFVRYWQEEPLPNGSTKTTRRFHTIGPSHGQNSLSRQEAEARRDRIIAAQIPTLPLPEPAVVIDAPVDVGTILFGRLAELWLKDHVENSKIRLV